MVRNSDLSNELICSPAQSRENISLKSHMDAYYLLTTGYPVSGLVGYLAKYLVFGRISVRCMPIIDSIFSCDNFLFCL
jgi:hypothetical protein